MRRVLLIALASASAAAGVAFGVGSASALTAFHCTRQTRHGTVHTTVRGDRAEDALEAHGFSCTGD